MKKKSSLQEAKPILRKSQEDLQELAKTNAELKEDDRKTFLPIAGGTYSQFVPNTIFSHIILIFVGVISFVTFAVCAFTILLILKLQYVVDWSYWSIFSPILCIPLLRNLLTFIVVLFILLVLTQSRTISTRFPLISRLAWLMCVVSCTHSFRLLLHICMIAFMLMLILKMEKTGNLFSLEYTHVFIPLWILFGTSFVLGISAVVVALCFSDTERRKSKYLTSGKPSIRKWNVREPILRDNELKLPVAITIHYPSKLVLEH